MKNFQRKLSLTQAYNSTKASKKLPSINRNPSTGHYHHSRSASFHFSNSKFKSQHESSKRMNSKKPRQKLHQGSAYMKRKIPSYLKSPTSKLATLNESNSLKNREGKPEKIVGQTSLTSQQSPSLARKLSKFGAQKTVNFSQQSSGSKTKFISNNKVLREDRFIIKVGQRSQITTKFSSQKASEPIKKFKYAKNNLKQGSKKTLNNPNKSQILSDGTKEEESNNLGSIDICQGDPQLALGKDNKTTQSAPSINKVQALSLTRTGSTDSSKQDSSTRSPLLHQEIEKEEEALPYIPNNSDLDIIHPCEDFMAILASNLAKLDYSLSNPKIRSCQVKDCKELRKLKHSYKMFASQFIRVGQIRNNVFVYSLALAKKVKESASKKFAFNTGEFLLIYAGCLFLSIKMVVDTEKWFLEDFSAVSGIEESIVEKMELFILEDALNFDVSISRNLYREEHLRAYRNVDRRVLKKFKKDEK